jgi:polysaccharide biosynthesis protein PslH
MNILIVSSYLPYPLFSGGHIRLYNLIKELRGRHEITLICEKRSYQKEKDINEVKKFCRKVITVDRKKQWSLKNIIRTGFSFYSFLVTGHTSIEMRKKVKKEISENQFDLIHAETSYIMQNIPKTDLPIVLVEHNIEYLFYKRYVQNSSLFLKPFLYLDVLKLKRWEEGMWKRANKLVAVSEVERKTMLKIRKDVEIVSNGVDTNKFIAKSDERRATSDEQKILFIGDFKWIQNKDSVEFIIKEIWSKVQSELLFAMNKDALKLWIVGKKIPDSIRNLTKDKSVIFDENAPKETQKIFADSVMLLSPIRIGAGTSYKILESMASGVPVITTRLGNAIQAKEEEEIAIAQNADEFVAKIKRLLNDKNFYNKISENGRKLVEKKYNWKKIASDLNSVYGSVASYD